MTALLHQIITAVAYVGFVAVVIGANLFILFYGPFVRWWKKPFGKHLFCFMLVLAASLDHNAAGAFVPSYNGSDLQIVVTAALCWAMAWVVWWRLKILLTVQIGRHHGNSEPVSPAPVSQDSHDHLGGADNPDAPVVEGLGPMGSGDERLGKRGGPLR